MEFRDVLRRRRTVRHDTDEPLAPEVVERVLDAALRAPSAGFSQGWAFLVLTEPEDRARSRPPARATQTPTMQDPPLAVVPLAHEAAYLERYARPDKAAAGVKEWPVPSWYVDTGMAALCMREGSKCEFGSPDEYDPVGGITVGHRHPELAPQDTTSIEERRRRKDDVVHRGRW